MILRTTIALVVAIAKLLLFCIVVDATNDTISLRGTASEEWQNKVSGAVPFLV